MANPKSKQQRLYPYFSIRWPTAAETVFAVIKKSKKGVDTATLMEKTGFNRVKIANNVKVLKKKGLVKSPEKGVYVKA